MSGRRSCVLPTSSGGVRSEPLTVHVEDRSVAVVLPRERGGASALAKRDWTHTLPIAIVVIAPDPDRHEKSKL